MWPDLLDQVHCDCGFAQTEELPALWRKVFKLPIKHSEVKLIPPRDMRFLGRCSTEHYPGDPNMPYHHRENAQDWEGGAEAYFNITGTYWWFDFVATGTQNWSYEFRVVLNSGDADTNDGFWGNVWDTEDGNLVADIMSTGDCITTIKGATEKYERVFDPKEIPVLSCVRDYESELDDTEDNERDGEAEIDTVKDGSPEDLWNRGFFLPPISSVHANHLNIERLIDLAIRVFSARIDYAR